MTTRSVRRVSLPALVAAVAASGACNRGLPIPIGAQAAVPVNPTPGIGLFLGVEPSAPVSGLTVSGAAIPNVGGTHHQVMLVAFATAADARDADGLPETTDPLDLSVNGQGMSTAPDDDNDVQDVFLAAMVSSAGDLTGAFNLRIFEVTQHPRCLTCHGQNYPGTCAPGNSHPTHSTGNQCVPGACNECHTQILPGVEFDSEGLPWRSPPFCDPQQDPGCTVFDFRGRTPADLCQSVANRFDGDADLVRDHLTSDPFIIWALTSGDVPSSDTNVATVPIDFDTEWRAAVQQWVDGFVPDPGQTLDPAVRFNCVSLGSRRDIVLASQTHAGGQAGNSSSRRPSIAYVPNPAFQVGDPAAAPAGTVYVAYDSDATNLVAGDTNGVADVFRSSFQLWVDAAFVAGDPTEGSVDLRYVAGGNVRASVRDVTGAQGTGRATNASIGASGTRIAFQSEDTNIADVNTNGVFDDDANSAIDVFVRDVALARTVLVSVEAGGLAPGNGASGAPSMASGSDDGVAFESLATDLVPIDGNGQRDVFYALLGSSDALAPTEVRRASLRGGGGEGVGGPSRRPSLYVIDADAGDVIVGFESEKTNLVNALPPNSTRQAYLWESATLRTTLLNQKRLPLTTIGSAQGGASAADSMGVRITPDGRYVLFESLADNIDVVRPFDDNNASDVFRVDVATLLGSLRVKPQRISITRDGQTADGPSTAVVAGGFRAPGVSDRGGPLFEGLPILFESLASNLPTDDTNDALLVFTP